jgi:hypothetical protein
MNQNICLKCLDYNEDNVCDTLTEQWAISLGDVVDQTLTFDYGAGDGDGALIEFYAAATPGGSDSKLNCFSNVGDLQGQVDPSIPNGKIDGFVITATTTVVPANFPTVNRAVLDLTFTSDIVNFAGFDGSNALEPTVEFCVKVTLADVLYKELALKYTINLNGGIGTPSGDFVVDADVATDAQTSVFYTATAYVCDESGNESDISGVTLTQGNNIYVCLESDSAEAPVTGFAFSVTTLRVTRI